MDKNVVLGTGLSGMVGGIVVELLSSKYVFENLSLETGFDIKDYDSVLKVMDQSQASSILHMAAKANVDACEDDKLLAEEGEAWLVNVEGTRNIVEAAKKTGKRVIYISTDFVFNGVDGNYTEESEQDPVNWYGRTKYEGELLVQESQTENTIARIAYPYSAIKGVRPDFVHRIIELLKSNQPLFGVVDHIFTPTYIDDLATGLDLLLSKNLPGIYHLSGSSKVSPFDAIKQIAKTLNLQGENVKQTTRAEYFNKDRAYRPFNLSLNNDKITKLGVPMRTFNQGLKEFSL